MRYLFGFLWVCALGVVPLVGCSEGACQLPLSDYCEGSDCPTWDQAFAEAQDSNCSSPAGPAHSGECGDLRYIYVGGLYGTIEYFDASGALVVAERFNDVESYCDETSHNIWYGPIPHCTRGGVDTWEENFCKHAGYEHCSSVAECGAVTESECLAHYNNWQCQWPWDDYVECVGEEGTCDDCATEHVPRWEACLEESE